MPHPNRRIYSNASGGNFVINPFEALMESASQVCIASAYFSHDESVRRAAASGKKVLLLVGLNEATSPNAVRAVHRTPNIDVRYYTERFHAKFYLFDDTALLGSANLTDNGLRVNREGVICLGRQDDAEAIGELKALFAELWESADVLTVELPRFSGHLQTVQRRCSQWQRLIHRMRRSSGARWSSWSGRAVRQGNWPESSGVVPRPSVTGYVKPVAMKGVVMTV